MSGPTQSLRDEEAPVLRETRERLALPEQGLVFDLRCLHAVVKTVARAVFFG